MNQNPIVNLFRLKGIGQTRIPRQVSTLAISLAMLLLWVLTAHAEEPVNDPMVGGPKPVVAPGTVIGKEAASDPAFLAENPELKHARRYAEAIESEGSQAAAYNVAALRYKFMHGLGIEAEVSQPIFFDKERLRRTYFQDWVLEADAPDVVKSSPAQTPDPWMGLVRSMYNRQAETGQPGMVIRPVTFDVEALHQTYFQDWVLEADTIDPRPLAQPLSNIIEEPATSSDVTISTLLAANSELSPAQRAEAMRWNGITANILDGNGLW